VQTLDLIPTKTKQILWNRWPFWETNYTFYNACPSRWNPLWMIESTAISYISRWVSLALPQQKCKMQGNAARTPTAIKFSQRCPWQIIDCSCLCGALVSLCEFSKARINEWWCFHYFKFVKNSLAAVLEAVFTRIVLCWWSWRVIIFVSTCVCVCSRPLSFTKSLPPPLPIRPLCLVLAIPLVHQRK